LYDVLVPTSNVARVFRSFLMQSCAYGDAGGCKKMVSGGDDDDTLLTAGKRSGAEDVVESLLEDVKSTEDAEGLVVRDPAIEIILFASCRL
jgi:hypothetical protein